MSRISDLSLLIYLAVISKKPLPKVMSKWSGCDESVYTEQEQIKLLEDTISEISSIYHCPRIIRHYFNAKRDQKRLEIFSKHKYSEIEVLRVPIFWIPIKTWDEEDMNRLKELNKEYIDKEEYDLLDKEKLKNE